MKRQLLIEQRATLLRVIPFICLLFSSGVAISQEVDRPEPLTRESALDVLRTATDPNFRLRTDRASSAERFLAYDGFYSINHRVYYWAHGCQDAWLFLSQDGYVAAELNSLTQPEEPYDVQFRIMYLLIQRGSPKGLRLAVAWMRSEDPTLRYAGWKAMGDCPNSDAMWNVISPQLALDLYRIESDSSVLEMMIKVFGHYKARFAVETLCRTLVKSIDSKIRDCAASALGEIGDPVAVETLIHNANPSEEIVSALGKIGDVKGADYVIEHLNVRGAPLALSRIGGPRARQALELERFLWPDDSDVENKQAAAMYVNDHVAEVELAMSLVKENDRQNASLKTAESKKSSPRVRSLAFEELQRVGISGVRARFFELYRSLMSSDLEMSDDYSLAAYFDAKNECLRVAQADSSDQATEVLKWHLSILCGPYVRSAAATRDSRFARVEHDWLKSMVLGELHKRIGNDVFALRDKFTAQHSADAATTSP